MYDVVASDRKAVLYGGPLHGREYYMLGTRLQVPIWLESGVYATWGEYFWKKTDTNEFVGVWEKNLDIPDLPDKLKP